MWFDTVTTSTFGGFGPPGSSSHFFRVKSTTRRQVQETCDRSSRVLGALGKDHEDGVSLVRPTWPCLSPRDGVYWVETLSPRCSVSRRWSEERTRRHLGPFLLIRGRGQRTVSSVGA